MLQVELEKIVQELKIKNSISLTDDLDFPSKGKLSKDVKTHLELIVEQAEKVLYGKSDFQLLNIELSGDGRKEILSHFIKDILQFATKNNIIIDSRPCLSYAQDRIPDKTFFHLAAGNLLTNTYKCISLNQQRKIYDTYSIPFKLRVAIESKIKSIIGLESCFIKLGNELKKTDPPISQLFKALHRIDYLELPCSLSDLANIYSWACSFCHTGEKEFIWMSMKALEITYKIFSDDSQKKFSKSMADIWQAQGFTQEEIYHRLFSAPSVVLYYLKPDWTLKELEVALNTPTKSKIKKYTFHLSEKNLDEPFSFYNSELKSWV
ncbi:hypothetical protein ABQG55_11085 [Aeromonas dhakensis]|uniref:hypothetical protein n=1 Tax=Aeromonas dhakensis TaxID=196024 RepID=UPI0029DAA5FC|nr:hypothetical protein [Aeromonas dhakensis]MDX7829998.1 hypothetical protein [Aeromonas dhakensis]